MADFSLRDASPRAGLTGPQIAVVPGLTMYEYGGPSAPGRRANE